MDAVYAVKSPYILPESIEYSDATTIYMRIVAALVVTIVVSFFVFFIPMNDLALAFFEGAALGVVGCLFPASINELSTLMQIFLATRKA